MTTPGQDSRGTAALRQAIATGAPVPTTGEQAKELNTATTLAAENARLRAALQALLARDEKQTCQHEETRRGGIIWTICNACGRSWADDQGGFTPFVEPPEWTQAYAALGGASC